MTARVAAIERQDGIYGVLRLLALPRVSKRQESIQGGECISAQARLAEAAEFGEVSEVVSYGQVSRERCKTLKVVLVPVVHEPSSAT